MDILIGSQAISRELISIKVFFRFLTAENIKLKTYSGINGKVNLNLKILPLAVTQAFLTASLVDQGTLNISAFQCDENTGLELSSKNIDIYC